MTFPTKCHSPSASLARLSPLSWRQINQVSTVSLDYEAKFFQRALHAGLSKAQVSVTGYVIGHAWTPGIYTEIIVIWAHCRRIISSN